MADIPWALLSEATITYASSHGIDFEYDGIGIHYRPPGGLSPSDYEFFGVEPPDEYPPPPLASFDSWHHDRSEEIPSSFSFGPVVGTQEQLAAWLFSGQRRRKKPDARPLHRKALFGITIWVRKIHRTNFEVWFRHEGEYSRAAQVAADELKAN